MQSEQAVCTHVQDQNDLLVVCLTVTMEAEPRKVECAEGLHQPADSKLKQVKILVLHSIILWTEYQHHSRRCGRVLVVNVRPSKLSKTQNLALFMIGVGIMLNCRDS